MAYDDFEQGQWTGKPIHLFIFTLQAKVWRFATCDRDYVVGANTYLAAPISRSAIEQTAEAAKDELTIRMPYLRDPNAEEFPPTQDLGDVWFPFVPSDKVHVTCLATHFGDTDPPHVEWMGEVVQPKFTDMELTLVCEPSSGTDKIRNLGAKWQRACWKTVYSTGIRGCNLLPNGIPITVPAGLTAVSGNNLTAAEFTTQARSFVGGKVRWYTEEVVPGEGLVPHVATITAHAGTTLTVDDADGLAVGDVVTAYTLPFALTATLSAVNGLTATAAAFGAAPLSLAGGTATWLRDDGLIERRSIMRHTGSDIVLLYGAADLAVGLAVTVLPGCPRTWAACEARGNTLNYGGAIYKPVKNPMDGVSMSWG